MDNTDVAIISKESEGFMNKKIARHNRHGKEETICDKRFGLAQIDCDDMLYQTIETMELENIRTKVAVEDCFLQLCAYQVDRGSRISV